MADAKPFLTYTRFVRQTGGMCSFAVVVLAWHPSPKARVQNPLPPEVFPPEFFPGLEEGVLSILQDRPAEAVLVDALYHQVDSNAFSFRLAGSLAAKEALERLPELRGPELTASQALSHWTQTQGSRLEAFRREARALLEPRGFQLENDTWWRRRGDLEQLVRVKTNLPRVPTEADLGLGLSSPELLEFLQWPDSWRQRSEQLPQEMAGRRASTLAESSPWELKEQCRPWIELISPSLDQYFQQHTTLESLLTAPGYLDLGCKACLQYLSGQVEEARDTAQQGIKKSLGFPRQKKLCELVLETTSQQE